MAILKHSQFHVSLKRFHKAQPNTKARDCLISQLFQLVGTGKDKISHLWAGHTRSDMASLLVSDSSSRTGLPAAGL